MTVRPTLFDSGIRPLIDQHLLKLAEEKRDYGEYWSASSAGYCMRKNIFDRLQIPLVHDDPRKQRVFTAGHVFHEWIQKLTKEAGVSLAQELEITDDKLMIKGHVDDIVEINSVPILYDYKSAHSRSFTYAKDRPVSHYHKMQVGTYLYMLRQREKLYGVELLKEARILRISKDDLRMAEQQVLWSPELEKEVVGYWRTLNGYWKVMKMPNCTCGDFEGGFMAREQYNPYFYQGKPCSLEWLALKFKERDENE